MQAIRVHEFGGPEVLRLDEVPDPTPGPGEVLIRVKAVGVNHAEHQARQGTYRAVGPLPFILGTEVAGLVGALGPGAEGPSIGTAVMARVRGAYAQLAVGPARTVYAIPGDLSFEQAAAIPVAFGTAWHALVTLGHVQPGERVLIHAVGSGVGSAALQLAQELGAWVVATAGQDWKLDRARQLGAAATINYQTQDVAEEVARLTEGQGVHVVLDGVGAATFPASVRSLANAGRLVFYGLPSGSATDIELREAMGRNAAIYGLARPTHPLSLESTDELLRTTAPWFADGRIAPILDSVYPLADAAAAHRRIMDRAQFGKIVLRVGDK